MARTTSAAAMGNDGMPGLSGTTIATGRRRTPLRSLRDDLDDVEDLTTWTTWRT
jgi:hypothetical protein